MLDLYSVLMMSWLDKKMGTLTYPLYRVMDVQIQGPSLNRIAHVDSLLPEAILQNLHFGGVECDKIVGVLHISFSGLHNHDVLEDTYVF